MTRPTVYDVAKEAGVSIATVSYAFAKPDRVKRETLQRVLEIADRLGYVPSASARGLAKGATRAIGVYAFDYLIDSRGPGAGDLKVPLDLNARHFPLYSDEVRRGVELECRAAGYAVMIGSGSRLDHVPQIIDVAGRVDALITFANVASDSALDQIAARIPVVELGGRASSATRMTVAVNNREAMAGLVEHLVDVHQHRDLMYVGRPHTHEMTERLHGFEDTITRHGLAANAVLESSPARDPLTRNSVGAVIASGHLPDAFVCATDQEALVVIDAVTEAGLRVPADVAVTGFDGILAGRMVQPILTTVRQPMEETGRVAVQKLLAALDPSRARVEDLDVEPLTGILAVGGTCGC